MDYRTLDNLRRTHPGWRLLAADNAPLVISFLQKALIGPNLRSLSQHDIAAKLDDCLFELREQLGEDSFPKRAQQYLDDWAAAERGWLRKYYPDNNDEPHYDITPATERVIDWIESLNTRQFIGTESRLMAVFALLREIVEGTEIDPAIRLAELEKRKDQLEKEIVRLRGGDVRLMDSTQVKDRFIQMAATARGLLSDFREVEQNFRKLDRSVREEIASWDGSKSALLQEILGRRDAIADSDQGKSFRAFWEFLMSAERQEELSSLLDAVYQLQPVQDLSPDPRLLRIHYDWLEAGEVAQRTVARLSQQLRRYVDDQAVIENRRIMEIIRELEQSALAVRDSVPAGTFMEISSASPEFDLTLDRPLFSLPFKADLSGQDVIAGDQNFASDALFDQFYVDRGRLEANLRWILQSRPQVSLGELLALRPLEQGLAELVTYLSVAAERPSSVIDDFETQTISWTDAKGDDRTATVPLILFVRQLQVVEF